jgi:hypothetical protein
MWDLPSHLRELWEVRWTSYFSPRVDKSQKSHLRYQHCQDGRMPLLVLTLTGAVQCWIGLWIVHIRQIHDFILRNGCRSGSAEIVQLGTIFRRKST